jgi:Leucine-rich repeat (LRR) protein
MKRTIYVIALTLFINTVCSAQDYYWISNGGDWKNPAHWSLTSGGTSAGVVPAATNNVYFDANSFTLPGQVVYVPDDGSQTGVDFKTMDWRGVTNNPTFQIKAVTSSWVGNTCNGSLYFDPNMTLDFNAAEFYMQGSADYDFDSQGHYMGQNCFLYFSPTTNLLTSHILSDINHAWIYVAKGTFNLHGHAFIGQSDTNYPSLWLGGTVSSPVIADVSNSIIDIGTLQISAYSTLIDNNTVMTIRQELNASGQDFNHIKAVSLKMVNGGGTNSNTFQTLEMLPGSTVKLFAGATQTVTNLIMSGNVSNPITLSSTTPGTTTTISKTTGSVNAKFVHLKDITATGGATFNASYSSNDGHNPGWNFLSTSSVDSLALVALYNSTAGLNWKNRTNWLTGPVNTWYGVTVVAGRVTRLLPTNNNLVGSLPPEIGNLSALFEITLDDNKLSGPIPPELGNITNLNILSFSRNQLSGTIPTELGNLTGLTQFWLDNNQLTGAVPASLANLTSVQMFFIDNNQLSDLPNLSTLTATTTFSVTNNNFTFEDIQPNASITGINYCCQKAIPAGGTIPIDIGSPLNISVIVGGTGNMYQWKKFGANVPGATSNTFSVAATTVSHAGYYILEITNPAAPNLTVQTTGFIVQIKSLTASEDSGYSFSKKIGAEALGLTWDRPTGIAVGIQNNIYVHYPGKIVKYDASGNLILSFPLTHNALASNGDISVDASDALYITSEGPSNLVKFDASGNFIFEITNTNGTYGNALAPDGNILFLPRNALPFTIRKHNSTTGAFLNFINLTGIPGSPARTFYLDIETDASGNIYTSDPSIGRLDKFSSSGAFISSIDLTAAGFNVWTGWHFTVAANNDIYLQTTNGKTFRFDSSGAFLSTFGQGEGLAATWDVAQTAQGILVSDDNFGLSLYSTTGNFIKNLGPQKNANGQFNGPNQIANDSRGFRYVVDTYNNRVQKFTRSGAWVSNIGALGTGNGQFRRPGAIAIDKSDNLYVTDDNNNRVQKFNSAGTYLLTIGGTGTGNGQFSNPGAVTISKTGETIVADKGNSRVQIFKADGSFISVFGSPGTGQGQFTNLQTVTVEQDGTILAADGQARLQRFTNQGQFVSELNMYGPITSIPNIATDIYGFLYIPTGGVVKKFDKTGGLITDVGVEPTTLVDGTLRSISVSSNLVGDTLWISDNTSTNRVSIFTANFRKATTLDSLALVDLYNSTNGTNWTTKTNWLTGATNTWHGVTMSGGKIRQLNLPNNNLNGPSPLTLASLDDLFILNLSNNKMSSIPNLSTHPGITTLDVSNNNLDFASLEANAGIAKYANQAELNLPADELIPVDLPHTIKITTGGTSNQYQWKKNGIAIGGANTNQYDIAAMARTNTGTYQLEVTNPLVPGLTLKSGTQRVTAVANISGKLQVSASTAVTNGKMLLLKINPGGVGYDTTRIQSVKTDGTYVFDKVVLDDYVMVGLGDLVQYKSYFPTYFAGSVFWEEATKIELNENRVGVDVTLKTLPTIKPSGDGQLSGIFSVGNLAGGRTQRARVEGAGASVRRGTKSGRPTETLEGEDIVAFLYTNENGEFDFKDLDEGSYILNIQYPGVPMDKESDIYITLGPKAKRQNVQKVEATAEAGKITVKRLIIVGIADEENKMVNVYPNPVAEELFIEIVTGSGEGIAVLTDMAGREYKRIVLKEDRKVMNVQDLISGMYVLTIHQQNKQISRSKIVIK